MVDSEIEPDGLEWEYAHDYSDDMYGKSVHIVTLSDFNEHKPDGYRSDGSPYWNYVQVRRRKAGPWVAVHGG